MLDYGILRCLIWMARISDIYFFKHIIMGHCELKIKHSTLQVIKKECIKFNIPYYSIWPYYTNLRWCRFFRFQVSSFLSSCLSFYSFVFSFWDIKGNEQKNFHSYNVPVSSSNIHQAERETNKTGTQYHLVPRHLAKTQF